jgi:hypothetical protein
MQATFPSVTLQKVEAMNAVTGCCRPLCVGRWTVEFDIQDVFLVDRDGLFE